LSAAPRDDVVTRTQCGAIMDDAVLSHIFDIADPASWPPLLREAQVLKILPISRSCWRSLIDDGHVTRGLRIGAKIRCWQKAEIAKILEHGIETRPRGRRALAREAQRRAAKLEVSADT
jgi:predicted DNA-binding transcriptional regulator AlpA